MNKNSDCVRLIFGLGKQLNESWLGETMYKEGRIAEAQEPVKKEQDTTDETKVGSSVRSRVEEPAICDEREWRRF